jgi:2-polyprenyl-3-methyl-5-hydroxy-6-metoxy-1,4-benzoquinol methylase
MQFEESVIPLLTGEKFENITNIRIEKRDIIYNRLDFLKNYLAGKRVIHVGCCDHIGLIEQKIKENTYLHKIITDVSSKCIGIDIDAEAVNFLNKIGYSNAIHYDLVKDTNTQVDGDSWDVIVLGEILEHVDNPELFLRTIHEKYFQNCTEILITVPFAFSKENFFYIRKGIERINTDHRYFFTPFTLAKILTVAGFKTDSFYFAERACISIGDKILKWTYKIVGRDVFKMRKFKIYKGRDLIFTAKFK